MGADAGRLGVARNRGRERETAEAVVLWWTGMHEPAKYQPILSARIADGDEVSVRPRDDARARSSVRLDCQDPKRE